MSDGRIPLLTPTLLTITPQAWYWVVANRAGVVYSSSAAAYVATDDTTYTDWLNLGNFATNILCDGELADVLTRYGLEGAVVLNTEPTDWGACPPTSITAAMEAAGCKITSTGTGLEKPPGHQPIDAHYQLRSGPFDTLTRTSTYINAYGQLPNNQPLVWPTYDVTVTFATVTDFNAVYQGLHDYYNAWQHYAMNGGTMPTWGTKTIA